MKPSRRREAAATSAHGIDPLRARHLDLAVRDILTDNGAERVLVDDGESPLSWLLRRKGRDGRGMITPAQFVAGERLRADFTRGQLTPRVTSNWSAAGGGGSRGGNAAADLTETALAARQRLRQAMDACGPELSGLLMDVCCFLRGLEEIERARGWPARSAKVVLQIALDRLARHYGFDAEARGPDAVRMRAWTGKA